MKGLGALLLLVQLLSCKAVPLGPFHPLHPRVIDCDDPESEAAAAVALDYINTHHLHGYKYALNSIEKIKVLPRRPTGEIFELELDLLETVCHIVNPLPVENCTVRPLTDYVVEGDCDVKLLKLDGSFSVLSTKCHSTPDSAEDITKNCADCPIFALLNDTQVITAVDLALAQYNGGQDGAYVKLLEIGRAQIQHIPDIVTVEFAVVATNCSAKDAQDHVDDCQPLAKDLAQFGFCNAEVLTKNSITVSCTIYEHQPGVTHHHLIKDHLGGQLPTVVHGFKHHDLRHFHHGSVHVTSESSSAEAHVGLTQAIPVVKRDVGAVVDPAIPAPSVGPGPKHPVCPGRIRHFQV
ncbi:alpha-2-HS-glycoprotein [Malaclemys terrapin pileata]|uniref:alpha-2-HS-glycoprotein n=1 Tax=Malaclemys terrapin pileata TaxID=2991368 RepID=UPI0023A88B25|nr:alpha-2-HS-glycoprotein [Malaclemys terrapin pileata]